MSLLFVAAGSLGVAILFRRYVKSYASDLLMAALIFGPPLLFWLEGQNLAELGFGGAYAKFQRTAERPVADVWDKEAEKWKKLSLAANDWDYKTAPAVGACLDYLVLRLSLIPAPPTSRNPEFNKYMVTATNTIKSSITCGKLVGVVILDRKGKYIASFDSDFFLESLSLSRELGVKLRTMSAKKFANLAAEIERAMIFGTALKFPRQRVREGEGYEAFIKTNDTVRAAWEELQTIPGEFLAVTDRRRNFKGILPRKTVEDLLLDTLAFSAVRPDEQKRPPRRRRRP